MSQKHEVGLALRGEMPVITITDAALEMRGELIQRCAAVHRVSNELEKSAAMDAFQALRVFANTLEKSREEVKAPVLSMGRYIDEKARKFCEETTDHEKRIRGLLAGFSQQQEHERREKEGIARRLALEAEKARKVLEAEEELVAQDQARQRLVSEEAGRKAAAPDTSLREAADMLARQRAAQVAADAAANDAHIKRQAEADEAERRATLARQIAAAAPAPKMVLDYEVVDVHALYAAARWAVELTPKRREILDALETMRASGAPVVFPGLIVREVPKISTR